MNSPPMVPLFSPGNAAQRFLVLLGRDAAGDVQVTDNSAFLHITEESLAGGAAGYMQTGNGEAVSFKGSAKGGDGV